MKIRWRAFPFLLLLTGAVIAAPSAYGADHLDGEAASADPAADITDVYAWMQNGEKINLIMNVFPLASASSRFSDSVQYVFRVNSQAGYGMSARENKLVCTFSTGQNISCDLNGDSILTDANPQSAARALSDDGTVRIFAGLRNDPFFFDLDNFKTVRAAVRDAVPSLNFDESGCPVLDESTKSVLVSSLTGGGGLPGANSPPVDFFESLNVLSIVIQADRSIFGPGPLYSVSASTHRTP